MATNEPRRPASEGGKRRVSTNHAAGTARQNGEERPAKAAHPRKKRGCFGVLLRLVAVLFCLGTLVCCGVAIKLSEYIVDVTPVSLSAMISVVRILGTFNVPPTSRVSQIMRRIFCACNSARSLNFISAVPATTLE